MSNNSTLNSNDIVNVRCPLCGGDKHRFERTVRGYTLVRCEGCSLVFVNPQPSFTSLMTIYQDKEDPEQLISLYADLATDAVLAEYDRKLEQLELMLGGKGKILDFACAAGYFLERATDHGWDACGVDISDWAKKAAEKRGLHNVYIGHLADLNFPDHHFDVVYAAQVLEHLQEPIDTLREIYRILKPGGILYVDVPNYQTIPIKAGKDDFYLNAPPQHINYFTPHTLQQLLEKSEFIIDCMTSEGGLKWENLFNRPITSDIADAYRKHDHSSNASQIAGHSNLGEKLLPMVKSILRPFVKGVLYDRAKVGITLVAISHRA